MRMPHEKHADRKPTAVARWQGASRSAMAVMARLKLDTMPLSAEAGKYLRARGRASSARASRSATAWWPGWGWGHHGVERRGFSPKMLMKKDASAPLDVSVYTQEITQGSILE